MPGNSQRRGAKRNPGSKKGQTVGTGGQKRRALQGKGPTPAAKDRTSHPAARRAQGRREARCARLVAAVAADRRADRRATAAARRGPEMVSGRNPVVEALRAQVPATALYVAERIDSDDRVRESLKLAGKRRRAADGGPPRRARPVDRRRRAPGSRPAGPAHTTYAHPDDLLAAATASASRRCSSRSTA